MSDGEKLALFLERDEDQSAGTVNGYLIPYPGEANDDFREKMRTYLNELLTKGAITLAGRASLRAGYNEFILRQKLDKK